MLIWNPVSRELIAVSLKIEAIQVVPKGLQTFINIQGLKIVQEKQLRSTALQGKI